MKLSERVSYLKGLMDGMELKDSKQGKVLSLMADILADMAEEVQDMQDQIDEVVDVVDAIDDDDLYEVTCPTCGDTICLNEQMIEEGSMNCPNCGELLEFDLEDEDEAEEEAPDEE